MFGLQDFQPLDKGIPVPLYYQLKKQILAAIEGGRLQVGAMLPTESELCEGLGISRPTIRQALSELVSEGYLYRLKGKGTFVAQPKIDGHFFQKLESFNQEMLAKGLTPSTQVLHLGLVPASDRIAERLGLAVGEPLLQLTRLRFADGEPIVYLDTYLPHARFPGLEARDFVNCSLYAILERDYAVRVSRVQRRIESVNATAQESEVLRCAKNAALCLVKTVAYTAENEPVEYSAARYRGDRNQFTVDLYR